jgi:hypothetical protein
MKLTLKPMDFVVVFGVVILAAIVAKPIAKKIGMAE